jgi:hypothetical protein
MYHGILINKEKTGAIFINVHLRKITGCHSGLETRNPAGIDGGILGRGGFSIN